MTGHCTNQQYQVIDFPEASEATEIDHPDLEVLEPQVCHQLCSGMYGILEMAGTLLYGLHTSGSFCCSILDIL